MINQSCSKIKYYEVTSSLKISNWLQLALDEYRLWRQELQQCQPLKDGDLNNELNKKTKQAIQRHDLSDLLYYHLKIYEGKPTINFKNQKAATALTKCILRVIFKIQWILPVNNLCPRVPNRLNYIMWIHRYVIQENKYFDQNSSSYQHSLVNTFNSRDVIGIDIGTGASLIYPLLGVRMFGWNFIATQIDSNSIQHAEKLIAINKFQTNIQILKGNQHFILKNVIDPLQKINFLMCNPPFFDTQQQFQQPLSIMTSKQHNTKGGQYQFFFALYLESFYFINIECFTILIGLARDFEEIKTFLQKQRQQYGFLEKVKFGKLNQSENTRFIVSWKVNKPKVKQIIQSEYNQIEIVQKTVKNQTKFDQLLSFNDK